MKNSWSVSALSRAFLGAAVCVACAPLDESRPVRQQMTVGQEIVIELCNRIASNDHPNDVSGSMTYATCHDGAQPGATLSPRLHALHRHRVALIAAIDTAIPKELGPEVTRYLELIMPLYDSGILPAQTRVMASLMDNILASKPALEALGRMGARDGYRPLRLAAGILAPTLNYPEFHELTGIILDLVTKGGDAEPSFQQTLGALQHELANAPDTLKVEDDSALRTARDLLVRTHELIGDGQHRYITKRDTRGVAYAARAANGSLRSPFVDSDGDGLADMTQLPDGDTDGRFVSAFQVPLRLPTPFALSDETNIAPDTRDTYGRAVVDGSLLYEYLDTTNTLAGGGMLETRKLLTKRPRAAIDLLRPAQHLLGTPVRRSRAYADGSVFAYEGFNVEESPLLDLSYLFAKLAEKPSFLPLLKLMNEMLKNNEPEVAELVSLIRRISDWKDAPEFDGVELEARNNFIDDMLELGAEIARVPGLMESILVAMQDPEVQKLGEIYALHMRTTDRIYQNPDDLNGPTLGNFVTPVNRSRPYIDSPNNRSVFARVLHLVNDASHAPVCNKDGATVSIEGKTLLGIPYKLTMPGGPYKACQLFQIDDMAVFYVKTFLGTAELNFKPELLRFLNDALAAIGNGLDVVEVASGITGLKKHPTPEAMHRLIFGERNSFLTNIVDPPLATDGGALEVRHPGTLYSWEREGYQDAIRPLMQAFANHGREDLIVKIMAVMHKHWPTPASQTTQSGDPSKPIYSAQTGASRFEPLFARMLDEGQILQVMGDFVQAASKIRIDGVSGRTILANGTKQLLLPEMNAGLTARGGQTVFKGDERTPIAVCVGNASCIGALTPAHLLRHALDKIDDRMDEVPELRDVFKSLVTDIADQTIDTEIRLSRYRFKNRQAYAMLQVALPYAIDRIEQKKRDGSLQAWADQLTPDLQDALDHPLTTSVVQMTNILATHEDALTQFEAVLLHFLSQERDSFDVTLSTMVDLVQVITDNRNIIPIAQALAPVAKPKDGMANTFIDFLVESHRLDTRRVLPQLLAGLVKPTSSGAPVIEVMVDAFLDINRADASRQDSLHTEDYTSALDTVVGFMRDGERGVERLYELIEIRDPEVHQSRRDAAQSN